MSTWIGSGKSQEDFLETDQCILVDVTDGVVGAAAKVDAHKFTEETPQGRLHRAFSVFLFDHQNRLLLQQRSLAKVTFPGVWTNTCCSHQLHGQDPAECDDPGGVATGGHAPGAIAAAIRKLEHELGIPQARLAENRFCFLTRLLYCAADRDPASGERTGWGEHELDYILFVQAAVPLAPNPDEVAEVRYVTQEELAAMMAAASGLRWSPWFRIIADRFLMRWWSDLQGVFAGKHADWARIHSVLAEDRQRNHSS